MGMGLYFERALALFAALLILVLSCIVQADNLDFRARFELINVDGKLVTEKILLGKYSLVFFGYTYCSDICPVSLVRITSAMNQLPVEFSDKIMPVFISVDEKRDSTAVLKKYAEAFYPRLLVLTGNPKQIKLATHSYRAYFSKQLSKDPDNYMINHTSLIYLMDPEGRYLAHFDFSATASQIADRLKAIIISK